MKIKNILFGALMFAVMVACGYVIGLMMPENISMQFDESGFVMSMVIIALAAMAAIYLATIVHEGGHLIAGLISGYKFLSFRVMSIVIIKIDGKLKVKFQSIAGTGGQCLLTPPPYSKDMPFKFYLLGGVLLNFLTAGLAALTIPLITDLFVFSFVALFAFVSVVFALVNGIPFGGELVQNDGKTLIQAIREESVRKALYIQLSYISKLTEGVSLLDMPDEWFYIEREKKDMMSTFPTLLYLNRLSLEEEFEKLKKGIEEVFRDNLISGINKYIMNLELLYCNIMLDCEVDESAIFTSEVKTLIKQMPTNPTILRVLYSYNLLYKKDDKKAAEIFETFERSKDKHPYQLEVIHERNLIDLARKKVEQISEVV